jgi:hypothetical protein
VSALVVRRAGPLTTNGSQRHLLHARVRGRSADAPNCLPLRLLRRAALGPTAGRESRRGHSLRYAAPARMPEWRRHARTHARAHAGYECADVATPATSGLFHRINPMGTEFLTKCRFVDSGPAWTLVAQEVQSARSGAGGRALTVGLCRSDLRPTRTARSGRCPWAAATRASGSCSRRPPPATRRRGTSRTTARWAACRGRAVPVDTDSWPAEWPDHGHVVRGRQRRRDVRGVPDGQRAPLPAHAARRLRHQRRLHQRPAFLLARWRRCGVLRGFWHGQVRLRCLTAPRRCGR